ncbi:carbohydrate kinase family protein [Patescibacteria group bacterium]|nr:carbohydrate kinase family protein [Patescibacteria group bacterium]MBU1868175.1 carbohydrate kinase family protein [Patescibacteria group bacterium]
MIVVTGSLAYDHILNFPGRFKEHIIPEKIHVISLSFLASEMRKQQGGTAGNIAYSLCLLGESPALFCTAGGKDFSGYGEKLADAGVDLNWVKLIPDSYTATFFGIIDQDDNQIGGFYPGAMEDSVNLSLRDIPSEVVDLVIIAPNEPTAMINFARECRAIGYSYVFDPGQQIPRLSAEELIFAVEGARVFIGNDYEIDLVLQKTGKSIPDILNSCDLVIRTLGRRGSEIFEGDREWQIPAVKAGEVVDPTGAGDAYRAGIIKGLIYQWPVEKMGKVASLSAVYAVEQYGAQVQSYTLDEFCERYKKAFGEVLEI